MLNGRNVNRYNYYLTRLVMGEYISYVYILLLLLGCQQNFKKCALVCYIHYAFLAPIEVVGGARN